MRFKRIVVFVKFESDPAKNEANIAKHGVPLALGGHILSDPNRVVFVDDRFDYGEVRMIAIRGFRGRVFTVVYTMRADVFRFISVRKAHAKEKARYQRG
jgi:uncharacterized protein